MNIVFDNIIFALQRAGGISIYWYELLRRTMQDNQSVHFIERAYSTSNIFRKMLNIDPSSILADRSLPLSIARYLSFKGIKDAHTIHHSSYYRVSLQKDVLNITTVHDFTYEYFRSGLAKYIHSWQKGFAIRHADGVVCVSENTKKDLLKFFPNTDESKIKVIYNGVSGEFFVLSDALDKLKSSFSELVGKKYILYVGDRSSYKNFGIAVNVLKNLDEYSLVVVGGKEFDDTEKKSFEAMQDRAFHFRGIDSKILNILYNNAFCLLYPSSYEGFGIPILEAMQAGCPVVTTNVSSIPEVCGDAGLMVDKVDVHEFVMNIKSLEKKLFRKDVVEKGFKQASKFSWDKTFRETVEFYRKVYETKFQ